MIADAEYRHALGAYLLGALDRDEEARLTAHIRSCPRCHAELLKLGGVVADLAVLAPDVAGAPSRTAMSADAAMSAGLDGPVGSQVGVAAVPAGTAGAAKSAGAARSTGAAIPADGERRAVAALPKRRMLAVAAAAACLAAAGGIGFGVGKDRGQTEAESTAQPAPPGSRTVEGHDSVTPVTGHAVLTPAAWGTGIHLTVAGTQQVVAAGVRCKLLVVARTGEIDTVGSWAVPEKSPTPAGERIPASTAIPLRDLARLLVVTSDGRELLAVSV